jgi:class 3 adenylate cyclase/RNA 3'-terminal phosphate cyclase/dephospho-CoA kinase
MNKKCIGEATLIAFTNTNHYEPHVVSEHWFGGDRSEVRPDEKGRFKALPFAIVSHRGPQYAAGLHGATEATQLMKSLHRRAVLLYEDERGRLWFCACDFQKTEVPNNAVHEDESNDAALASRQDAKIEKGPIATILFTDIERSTEITIDQQDAKARKLFEEHDRIISAAVSTHDGRKIKFMGDGMMAQFSSASGAVNAAISMQREITAHFRELDFPMRIRIGINAGEPVLDDGDLYGSSVNLAARVMGKAAGGQILVSETVRNLVSGKPYEFVHHGMAQLKGFDEPLKLFEVLWTQEKLLILGLAGKAGSGFDSEVVDILRRHGAFEIISTDKIADAAWELPDVRLAVAETFGKERIFDSTSEDPSKWTRKRGVLGEIVASDREFAEQLSDILNPYATAQTFEEIRKLVVAGKRHIALASTRLTNKEQKLFCHQTWYVDRDNERRRDALQRDYSERGLAEEYTSAKVDQIMRLQRDVIEPGDFPYDQVIVHPENKEALAEAVTKRLREMLLAEQRSLNDAREFCVGPRRGQFVRSMLSLAQITQQPIRLKGKNLFDPRSGELRDSIKVCLEACVKWGAGEKRIAKQERAIEFWPGGDIPSEILTFDLTNELSVALLVVTLIPLCLHHDRPFQFILRGCTDLDRSSPCDYYKNVLFPLLSKLGIDVHIDVEKRGFWKSDLGSVRLSVRGTTNLLPLDLKKKGELQSVRFSHNSVGLNETFEQRFVEQMSAFCKDIGFTGPQQFEVSRSAGPHKSVSMSVALTTEHSILGADAVCDNASNDLAYIETISRLLNR